MKIYRIENNDKKGVYRYINDWVEANLQQDYRGGPRHPSPMNDSLFCDSCREKDISIWSFSGKYVFGFTGPKQLFRWFYDEDDLIRLEDEGFQVSVYECDDVLVGHTQIAFNQVFHENNEPIEVYSLCQFVDKFSGITTTSCA